MRSPLPRALHVLLSLAALIATLLAPAATASAQTITPIAPFERARQLIVNGGFEAATDSPWIRSGFAGSTSSFDHCGAKSMYLPWGQWGVAPNLSGGAISQDITPVSGTLLDFWVYFPSNADGWQKLEIRAYNLSTSTETFLAVFANNGTDPGIPFLAPGAWRHVTGIDLSPVAGQTVRLKFVGRFNPSANTNNNPPGFYLDDIAAWTPGLRLTPISPFPSPC
jgi:hypothetical protein